MSKFLTQNPLILASSSKIRIQLLRSLSLDFEVVPARCDEEAIKKELKTASMLELASALARCKALEVSNRYPKHFVIAADQLCIIDDKYLDKPLNHTVAMTHLRLLSGKTHQQISAYCIAKAGKLLWQDHDSASLTMRELSDKTIDAYLTQDQPYQSCGAYHFEESAKWLFTEIKGSDSTILGLPLMPLAKALISLQAVIMTS
ncbi:Maf family protein [Legionella jamestowniensis]|uniref:Nucleoside triphosphate pyrophosphatase n=1 Tax=Legionella jamestowniensis TaxID=455 RepID=A0A0W0UKQ8_9GAMM|nr:nucleoside triphosphate pyrophosphatase [Legionella jamestowniensis]KTD08498.1 Maf-like protein [Legionella jamestowniensis]OCH97038.1 septum formation protein Maf [Legionella jamestowniensis]SFL52027.1 septum formation protein [Legionella jamestowniensis DSM 19215]